MTSTPILAITEHAAAQALQESTANEAYRRLEQAAGFFPRIKDKDLTSPPGSPAEGDAYIVAAAPTGAWSGWADRVAFYQNGAWESLTVGEGYFAWVLDEDKLYRHNGTTWVEYVAASSYSDDDARAAVAVPPTAISGTTHTLVIGNANQYLRATNASGCAITVPPNADVAFEIGTVVTIRAATAGTVSLVAGSGVTLNPPGGSGGSLDFAEEGAVVQVKKVATNEWDVIGNTAA